MTEINIFFLSAGSGEAGYFFAKMNNKTVEKQLTFKQAKAEISKLMIGLSRKQKTKKHV